MAPKQVLVVRVEEVKRGGSQLLLVVLLLMQHKNELIDRKKDRQW